MHLRAHRLRWQGCRGSRHPLGREPPPWHLWTNLNGVPFLPSRRCLASTWLRTCTRLATSYQTPTSVRTWARTWRSWSWWHRHPTTRTRAWPSGRRGATSTGDGTSASASSSPSPASRWSTRRSALSSTSTATWSRPASSTYTTTWPWRLSPCSSGWTATARGCPSCWRRTTTCSSTFRYCWRCWRSSGWPSAPCSAGWRASGSRSATPSPSTSWTRPSSRRPSTRTSWPGPRTWWRRTRCMTCTSGRSTWPSCGSRTCSWRAWWPRASASSAFTWTSSSTEGSPLTCATYARPSACTWSSSSSSSFCGRSCTTHECGANESSHSGNQATNPQSALSHMAHRLEDCRRSASWGRPSARQLPKVFRKSLRRRLYTIRSASAILIRKSRAVFFLDEFSYFDDVDGILKVAQRWGRCVSNHDAQVVCQCSLSTTYLAQVWWVRLWRRYSIAHLMSELPPFSSRRTRLWPLSTTSLWHSISFIIL